MDAELRIGVGKAPLFVPRNGPQSAKQVIAGAMNDASITDVLATAGIPAGVHIYCAPNATRYVSVPVGTGNIAGSGVDWNIDTETVWFAGTGYKPPKYVDTANGIGFTWDATSQKVTITNAGSYLGAEYGSRYINPTTRLGHFEWFHRDVIWFASAADVQTLQFDQSRWFGDLQTYLDGGTGLYTEETAYIEVEVVAFTRGTGMVPTFARFRAVWGALIRKGQSGGGTDWEIDENFSEFSGQHLSDGITPGNVSVNLLLSGTNSGTLNFQFSCAMATAPQGPTTVKIRILGGAKYA